VFVAGQGPINPSDGSIVGMNIQDQTAQCLRNIEAILVAAGSSMQKVVSATFLLRDPYDFKGMNEEWERWFPVDPPARQCQVPDAIQRLVPHEFVRPAERVLHDPTLVEQQRVRRGSALYETPRA